MANGDPRAVEEGTRGIKSAPIGYALALAPTLLSILEHPRPENGEHDRETAHEHSTRVPAMARNQCIVRPRHINVLSLQRG